MRTLLLASNSPRRRKLLADAGFAFQSVAPLIAEKFDTNLTVRELTIWNAFQKGISIARANPARVVLSADTLVSLDHQTFGKPRDRTEAFTMLTRLNGRVHEVCSAVFICHLANARSTSFCEVSHVHFRRLSPAAIHDYLDRINPIDKAGGYAAQEFASRIIKKIEGSYSNVVGLPMEKTLAALAEFGIKPK